MLEEQLNTLFGNQLLIVGDCYVCGSLVTDTLVHPYFLEGCKVWCETCDDWREVSRLTQRTPDGGGLKLERSKESPA